MSNTGHRHTPAEERAIREAALDETIAETFPASDPPSSIPNPDEHDAGVKPDEPDTGVEEGDKPARQTGCKRGA
jgi:hypothetical protein